MSEYITDTNIVELRRSRTTISTTPEFAWQDGASDIRDLYEAELSRLRQERDELLGALRPLVGMWIAFTEDDEDGPADISHENAYQTFYKGMSGEWNKARAILSRHKPE